MKRNILSFLDHVKIYTEYYFAAISAIGILWGGFMLYDNWRDDNNQLREDVKFIITTQKESTKLDSILLKNQIFFKEQLDDIQLKSEENSERLEKLEISYVKHLSKDKSLSKDDFIKYMEELTRNDKRKLFSENN